MVKEIRDPVHVFVYLDSDERQVLDSSPFQRLRHIHQMALSYLLYPAATHKRFEHSLGVMELASQVYDTVTAGKNITDDLRKRFADEITVEGKLQYWRRALRMAALCHDMGHLPFSHAAEEVLLPSDWTHERLTREIVLSAEMRKIWSQMRLDPLDIVRLAIGPEKARDIEFSSWETILSEIIGGDAFGADRIDYLLRDSHHVGVAYGRFDHHRLIDTMRILPPEEEEGFTEAGLGVEVGGLQSAEALLWARYLLWTQVCLHPVRRIYDIHLRDFLSAWLPGGKFPTSVDKHLEYTDVDVTHALFEAAKDASHAGHEPARRIIGHEHFKVLWERNPRDIAQNPDAMQAVYEAAKKKYGDAYIRYDRYPADGDGLAHDFPVRMRDGRVVSAYSVSETFKNLPVPKREYVFAAPELCTKGKEWLERNREAIIPPQREEE